MVLFYTVKLKSLTLPVQSDLQGYILLLLLLSKCLPYVIVTVLRIGNIFL